LLSGDSAIFRLSFLDAASRTDTVSRSKRSVTGGIASAFPMVAALSPHLDCHIFQTKFERAEILLVANQFPA